MGYTTTFEGSVRIDPPLNESEVAYLMKFSETRRMFRQKGPYYVEGTGYAGQGRDDDVMDRNASDPSQPGLWCKWVPTEDGRSIEWSGMEKFYDSEEWMQYLIDHFLKPDAAAKLAMNDGGRCPTCGRGEEGPFEGFTFDHVVNGRIYAQGEDPDDKWMLVVENNRVSQKRARIVWE